MKRMTDALTLLIAVAFSSLTTAQPDGTPVTIGEQFTIESTILDEQRSFIVGVPQGYESSEASYPVLYVLDGSQHFHYTTGITEFLAANQFIPQMIVVAVNNTDRRRDLTPPSQVPSEQQRVPTHGGADRFKRYISEELMPWVEQHYRTHPYKVLVGHSFGGLFAIHTLTTNPELFNAYIAISPSLQWNDQGMVRQAERFLGETRQLPVSLYMTAGNEGAEMLGGIRKLAGVLDSASPTEFLWQFDHMPRETHGSVPHRSTYQGLEFVFSYWALRNPYEVYTRYGLEAVEQFHALGDQRYGVDRGIPTLTLSYLLGDMVRADDLEGAVALMDLPSTRDNSTASLYIFLAGALRDSGERGQSVRFYRLALQQSPGDMTARSTLDEWGVDYTDIVPEPRIDPRVLRRYQGVYSSAPTGDITITEEDGRLYRELNANRSQLHPLSDSEFYLLGSDARYHFQVTENGRNNGITITQGGAQVFARRR